MLYTHTHWVQKHIYIRDPIGVCIVRTTFRPTKMRLMHSHVNASQTLISLYIYTRWNPQLRRVRGYYIETAYTHVVVRVRKKMRIHSRSKVV